MFLYVSSKEAFDPIYTLAKRKGTNIIIEALGHSITTFNVAEIWGLSSSVVMLEDQHDAAEFTRQILQHLLDSEMHDDHLLSLQSLCHLSYNCTTVCQHCGWHEDEIINTTV